jgi:PAS domain S-box-containing protein
MKKPLRVLIVEDAERDALLLARQLRLGGYDPAMTRVENAAELLAALTEAAWDIVLCDYRMPGFDGLAALKLVQAHQCDVPFILVSGVIGEDEAVATMKAGAHDFILKDKLARLVPAVERELREAEMRRRRRQAEEELQIAHNELEARVRERTAELVAANAALQRVNRALKTLSECNQVLVSATTELDLLQRICQLLVSTGGYNGAWVEFAELDLRQHVRPVAQAGLVNGHLEKLTARWADAGLSDGPADTAMRTRQPYLHLTELPATGVTTGQAGTLALPLQTSNQSIGVLMILAASAEAFDADAIELLTKLANDLAFGLIALRTQLERDQAAQALKKWAQLFQRAHWGVAVASADGNRLEMLNPAYAAMHGDTEAGLTGAPILSVCAPESRAEVAEQIRLAPGKERAIFEARHLRKDGTTFPALVDMSAVRDEQGQIVYWVIYTQDISTLKSLEARILDISEQEQQRIGQDLHDSLCQQLSGIAYLCHSAWERIACVAPTEAGALNRVSELLQEAIDQARGLARGLHPVENEVNGLVVALQGMVGSFQHIYRVSARFLCAKQVLILDNAVATHLYRIAQEAMSNAVKHGRASQIVVRLSETKDSFTLSVKDNGCGFPVERPKSRGLGLETMRFRARAIGAELEIDPGAKGGTELTCTLRKRKTPQPLEESHD